VLDFTWAPHVVDGGADGLAALAGIVDGFVVVEANLPSLLGFLILVDVGDDDGAAAYEKHVRAEVEHFLSHVAIQAVDDADHGDNRHDPYHDAQERQDAAELVRPQAACGNAHRFAQLHGGFAGHCTSRPSS